MINKYRILFMGTPAFAVNTLDILVKAGFDICAVVTAPDKPAGRGQLIRHSEVKEYALEKNLLVLQPEKLSDPLFLNAIKALKPDLAVVVAFRMLPEVLWSIPVNGTINLHASLLPLYRGAAPINWVLINGEKESGITTFFIDKGLDTGKILYQDKVSINTETNAGELHDLLMNRGAELVLQTVRDIADGKVEPSPQPTYSGPLPSAPKLSKQDSRINWHKPAVEVHNLIRGLSPYPGAWTELHGPNNQITHLKVYKGKPSTNNNPFAPTGSIRRTPDELLVRCIDHWYVIEEAQWPGRKRMPIAEMLRGYSIDEAWLIS